MLGAGYQSVSVSLPNVTAWTYSRDTYPGVEPSGNMGVQCLILFFNFNFENFEIKHFSRWLNLFPSIPHA